MSAAATIPAELRERDQWLLWRYVERDGKHTKVPFCAATPWREASSTDPATWSTFERASEKLGEPGVEGLGYVFSGDDPFAGIDLDGCLDDNGEIEEWAAEIVEQLDSYTERTPGGRGLHVIVRGELRGSRRRRGSFEAYDRARFFTVSGERVGQRETVEERHAQLD